jgi:TfoX/Sxy family transcriptional regulator of competence genes
MPEGQSSLFTIIMEYRRGDGTISCGTAQSLRQSKMIRRNAFSSMAYDQGLADRIRTSLPQSGVITERKMFGGLAFLCSGHMCCGVVKDALMLRLGDEGSAAALREPHTRPMDFTGKPLKSMIYVEAAGIDSDQDLRTWVESALAFVKTLPPK